MVKTRVLVAFENEYRIFQDAVADAIRILRPRVEVEAAELSVLASKVTSFDPHLVICSRPNTFEYNKPAWIELPPDPNQLAEICLDRQRLQVANPALKELLRVVDETERLTRIKQYLGNC